MLENRLAREKSPYLLQHCHNPVDWFPWGDEAFEKARRERKPIFLSVGYSTCHWCHVMERESFENQAIAALLNESFVSVKVDREERPDVDRVYMTYVQATGVGGGWPMSVFLTPNLKPFFGGTYFPPEDRWGRPGFATVLRNVAEMWRDDRAGILAHGDSVIERLGAMFGAEAGGSPAGFFANENGDTVSAVLAGGVRQIAGGFDAEFGGFSDAPKFPRPATLHFLLRNAAAGGADASTAREMALFTLRAMAAGGIHDHLGGGFHRYSVDRFWHVPHFEKMLYDQAQLACAYLEAAQIAPEGIYAGVARGVLDYLRRDLTAPGGAFFSAEDADSALPENPEKRGEGAFYVWTEAEIDEALAADDAALFARFYGVEPHGNAPAGSDPHGELAGTNTLIQRMSVEELARQTGAPVEAVAASLARSRQVLFERRARRPRPHLDDKIVTAWNGLAISAFARGAGVLGDPYLDCALRAAAYVREKLWRGGRLLRCERETPGAKAEPRPPTEGFADDYAFLIQGLLDLYEAGGGHEWLSWAAELQTAQDRVFLDPDRGGYFSTSGADPSILLRGKESYDGAEPSPNSVAALNAFRLGRMLDSTELIGRAQTTVEAFSSQLVRSPTAMPIMLSALLFGTSPPRQIILAGRLDVPEGHPLDLKPFLRNIHDRFQWDAVLLFADGGPGQEWLGRSLAFIRSVAPVNGRAAAYLCDGFACQAPVTTVS